MATQSNSVLSRPAAASQPKPYTSSLAPSRSYLASSIGTKVLIGATGLLLFTYLILHLAGNVLVFFGPEVFNGYSHLLISNPLVIPIEIGLAAIFVIHIYKAVTNFIANRRARPVKYYQTAWSGKPSRKNLASTTMILSGLIIFGFVLLHLWQFKYGPSYVVEQATPGAAGGEPVHGIRDLYRLEMEVFSNPLNVGFYVVAMIVVGSHLWHGIASAFDSLGADHPRYTPWVLRLGKTFAIIIGGVFLLIPLWVYLIAGPAFAS